ncbi:hypothetical protein [Amycolatopsis sp. NPDC004169]|uniref:hypothetical protein n=1 Tax=Amycolatopsis sp. NPDC004169 TaxID=3154453 RepID=UPI0033B01DC3
MSAFRKTTTPVYGCSWVTPLGANATASKPANNPRTLTELAESPAPRSPARSSWRCPEPAASPPAAEVAATEIVRVTHGLVEDGTWPTAGIAQAG